MVMIIDHDNFIFNGDGRSLTSGRRLSGTGPPHFGSRVIVILVEPVSSQQQYGLSVARNCELWACEQ